MAAERDETILFTLAKKPDVVTAVANLTDCMEATVTLEAQLRNMGCDQALPYTTEVVKPSSDVANFWPTGKGPTEYGIWGQGFPGRRNRSVRHDYVYALPYTVERYVVDAVFPEREILQRKGGGNPNDEHVVSWRMPEGTTIRAMREGVVICTRTDGQGGGPRPEEDGVKMNYLVIRHADGTYGRYMHLQNRGALVPVGAKVARGQPIAYSGATGWTPFPQLAFQVYVPVSGKTVRGFPITVRTRDGKVAPLKPGKQYYL